MIWSSWFEKIIWAAKFCKNSPDPKKRRHWKFQFGTWWNSINLIVSSLIAYFVRQLNVLRQLRYIRSNPFYFPPLDYLKSNLLFLWRRFLGRAHFLPQIWEYGNFFGQETYIHFVAQETRIVRKLFIFNFFHKKGRNRQCKRCNYRTLIADFDLFWWKFFSDNAGFLGYKVSITLPDWKITIFPNLWYKNGYVL